MALVGRFHGGVLAATLVVLTTGPAASRAAVSDPEYLISTWQTDQGLPENSATAMVQTPDGYLWFGTFNGLVRFDGVRFHVFDRLNTPELPSAEIVNLHLDRRGRLWVSTPLGMACVQDGRWQVYRHGHGWTGNYARFFAEAADGRLYVGTYDDKLLQLGDDGFHDLAFPHAPFEARSGVRPHIDEDGALWAVTDSFVGRFTGGRWESMLPASAWHHEVGVGSASARDGGLWLLSHDKLRKLSHGRVVREWPTPEAIANIVWRLFEDSTGVLWVASLDGGLYRFSRQGTWRQFLPEHGLAYRDVRFVFEDQEGNLWVGTSGGGLQRFRPRSVRSWGAADGLGEPVVKAVTEDHLGRIVIGTHGGTGVARFDGTTFTPVLRPGSTRAIAPHIYSVLADGKHRLWVGAYDYGLHRLEGGVLHQFGIDAAGTAVREWDADREAATTGGFHVYSLFEDSRGRIWSGTDRGLVRFDDGLGFTLYPVRGSTPLHSFRCIAEDPTTGAIWAGHHAGGLYRVEGDHLEPWGEASGVARERIASLHADADGTLWIATEDGSLGCLHRGRLARLGPDEGLPARRLGAILDDGLGSLWIASNQGIFRIRREDALAVVEGRKNALEPQVLTVSDGLPALECSIGHQPAAIKDSRGRLWFATVKGLAMVDPRSLRWNALPPPVAIQEVWIDGRLAAAAAPFATSRVAPAPEVIVPAGSRRIEIRYAGLSFEAPEKVRFRYRLDGLDEEWIDVGDRRVAYFQDLRPGRYSLHVTAANNDGIWNQAGAALVFRMQPFLWQTGWFRTLAATALLGVFGLATWRLVRFRLRRQLERVEQQRALEREKARLALVLEATSDFVGFSDAEGNLLYVNPAGRSMTGLGDATDVRGRRTAELLTPWAAEKLEAEAIPYAREHGLWRGESAFRGTDGREIPMSHVIAAHRAPDGSVAFFSTIARDIRELQRAHAQAQGSLREKEVLLQELHHRVKNNLQIISSLLNMQARQMSDPSVIQAFENSRDRVRSMALLHEHLYLSPSLSRVDLSEYVSSLASNLVGAYSDPSRIHLLLEVEAAEVGLDTAVPCGLIVNELVSNALKHAFPGGRAGTISVALRAREEGRWRLIVSDDGVGLPAGLDFRSTRTLGMQLVVTLTDQLGGTIESRPGPGATFEVAFSEARYRERVQDS